jgi:hypothetical protein
MRRLLTCLPFSLLILVVLFDKTFTTGLWQYGGFVDVAYLANFNFPENHEWRSKQTTPRTNEFAPNRGLVYWRKDPAVQ